MCRLASIATPIVALVQNELHSAYSRVSSLAACSAASAGLLQCALAPLGPSPSSVGHRCHNQFASLPPPRTDCVCVLLTVLCFFLALLVLGMLGKYSNSTGKSNYRNLTLNFKSYGSTYCICQGRALHAKKYKVNFNLTFAHLYIKS